MPGSPTTIGGLLSAIGIAGMVDSRANVIALSGHAVEAAGDVDVLLDKTGTITLGNREATELIPARNCRGASGRRCTIGLTCR